MKKKSVGDDLKRGQVAFSYCQKHGKKYPRGSKLTM